MFTITSFSIFLIFGCKYIVVLEIGTKLCLQGRKKTHLTWRKMNEQKQEMNERFNEKEKDVK